MQDIDVIFSIVILVMSVVVHEVSHGLAALALGDKTAKYAGRLTLNPLKHIDPVGSILVPLISSFSGFVFGWAKPVPYNPYNLKNQKIGPGIVAIAGPISNLAIAVIFGLLIRFSESLPLSASFLHIAGMIVIVNIILPVFNLIPIPPLDGSRVLFAILPRRFSVLEDFLEQIGFVLLLIFIFFFSNILIYPVNLILKLIIG